MEAMRQSWTDERLDDGFDRVHSDLRDIRGEIASVRGEVASVRGEINSVRGEVNSVRGEVNSIRGELNSFRMETNSRFDDLQRTLFQIGGGLIVALIGLIATQL